MFKIILLLTKDFFFPGIFLLWQWKRQYASKFEALFLALMTGAYITFIYYTGDWYLYGHYVRYILLALFLITTIRSLIRVQQLPFWVKSNPREKFGFYFISFFSMLFLSLAVWAFWGKFYSVEPISLKFPFKNGRYYIMEGGDCPLINHRFHTLPPTPKKFSLGIVKLNAGGTRASGLFPDDPNAYEIFGETIYSPGDGVIIAAVDSLENLAKADSASEEEFFGNHIVIQAGENHITLAQLLKGSLQVQPGDTVIAGQALARAGNSGESPEPHLHIHASRKNRHPDWQQYWEREGIPMLFEGKFLVKNDIFEALSK